MGLDTGKNMEEAYLLYAVLEFDSDRKCMSVIIRSERSGQIFLITKGADAAIEKRLNTEYSDSNSEEHVQLQRIRKDVLAYAEVGLRTLMVATKKLSEKDW